MLPSKHHRVRIVGLLLLLCIGAGLRATAPVQAAAPPAADSEQSTQPLSPFWTPNIAQWAAEVAVVAAWSGIDPDLIAAVIREESNGDFTGISRVGAVGLMGVMPSGPGLEWRPVSAELLDPAVNLRWGVGILSEIIRQSGGDVYAALAAYNGGWSQSGERVPQEYAASVLDSYGRAVAVRSGIDPGIAGQWTVAVEIRNGNVPPETILYGSDLYTDEQRYGQHLVYAHTEPGGQAFYVRGWAVPVVLSPTAPAVEPAGSYSIMPDQLLVRQGVLVNNKEEKGNPHVLLACLPSLNRLRGYVSTRWYAPSACPAWHR